MQSPFIALATPPERGNVRRSPKQTFGMAIALMLALFVVACGSDSATTEDPDEPTTTTEGTTETTETSAATTSTEEEATTTTTASTETTEAVDDGGVLDFEFSTVPEGTWQVESLGTPTEIQIEGDWFIQANYIGFIIFSAADSVTPGDRDVLFTRLTSLRDPTHHQHSGDDQHSGDHLHPWPWEDLEGWLDAIGDDVMVSEPVDAEVGGAEGIVFEVEVPAGSEGVDFIANGDVNREGFSPGHRYRVYWLDQGDYEPLAIIVGDRIDSFEEWAPTAESLLENVVFGEPAQNPIP